MTKRIIIIDDDAVAREATRQTLLQAGYDVSTFGAMSAGLEAIAQHPPDGVIFDMMMPGIDGLEACRRLRQNPDLALMKIIILSSRCFAQERELALTLGANAYLVKPIEPLELTRRVDETMCGVLKLAYWGVRGTLPVAGRRSLRFGGNTSCVALTLPDGRLVIFDAGSGIYELSRSLGASNTQRLDAMLLVSHPHWDHVNALPFFQPLYQAGNCIEMFVPEGSDQGAEAALLAQMGGVHFPITSREFAAQVRVRAISAGSFERRGLKVTSLALSHPGLCLGYRVDFGGASVCYVTDNELFKRAGNRAAEVYMDRLAEFVYGANILITDTTYSDEQYSRHVGWGHSGVSEVVELAVRGEVDALHLFHHDPSQSDDDIAAKQDQACILIKGRGAKVQCLAPCEGDSFEVKPNALPKFGKIAS